MSEAPKVFSSARESKELGGNVVLDIVFQRHGLREGRQLTDEGRAMTADYARESGRRVVENPTLDGEYHAVKAIGSPSDTPCATSENPHPMSRALETAHITATAAAGERAGEWKSRGEQQLNYETIRTPEPYDHLSVYDPALQAALQAIGKEKLGECTPEEKATVTQQAQEATMQHLDSLTTPAANAWKREKAGMFADLIFHYADMATLLKNGSKVAYIAGSHGGTIEHLIQQAAVWKDKKGGEHIGYPSIEAFGGAFDSSESYTVHIETDANKKVKELTLSFANPHGNRPQGHLHLDVSTLSALAENFRRVQERYDSAYAREAQELGKEPGLLNDGEKKEADAAGRREALDFGIRSLDTPPL